MKIELIVLIGILSFYAVDCQSCPASYNCGSGQCVVTTNPTYPYACRCSNGAFQISPCSTITTNACSNGNPCGTNACIVTSNSPTGFLCECASNDYRPTACTGTGSSTCTSTSCLNNGVCVQYSASNAWCNSNQVGATCCQCRPGFTGNRCETDINECVSNPCLNGGVCSNLANYYQCSCPTGYSGTNCQTSSTGGNLGYSECTAQNNICYNGGVCFQYTNGHRICQCPVGTSGAQCQNTNTNGNNGNNGNTGNNLDVVANFPCTQDGLYKDTSNCAKYIQCVYTGQVHQVAYRRECPSGLFFNASTRRCDWPYNVTC